MHDILSILNDEMKELGANNPEIYWSVENNSLGEAALIVIDEMDEDKFRWRVFTRTKEKRNTKSNQKRIYNIIQNKNYSMYENEILDGKR